MENGGYRLQCHMARTDHPTDRDVSAVWHTTPAYSSLGLLLDDQY
jgi:hypothetical protein